MPYIVFGLLSVMFGLTIYIILPQALLTQNLGLVLQIFFFILVCMILGLALLSTNLRSFFEKLIMYILLFWERRSMRALLRKNLMAHKATNTLTSVIYALTLGCVIFLCVSLNLMLRSIMGYLIYYNPMSDVSMFGYFTADSIEDVLTDYADQIKDFGLNWVIIACSPGSMPLR